MIYYTTSPQNTPLKAPKLPDSYFNIARVKSLSNSISVSSKQHIVQETVCRENVQILGHVVWFKMAIEELNNRIQELASEIRGSEDLDTITHRDISFLRKNSTSGKVTHETFSVVPKVTLEVSPVTGQKDLSNREFSESSQMVGGSTESYGRCSYPSSCSQHIGIYRCLPKRLGSSLERNSSQGPTVKQGGSASHQRIRAKSCSPGPKGVSGALARSKCAHLFRQQYSSILSEQRRRHPFHRNVCSYLENSGIHKFQKDPHKSKTCTWIPKCDSRLPIKKGQGHTEGSLHQQIFNQICKVWHISMVDLFAAHLNYKLPIYVSPVPDKKAWKIDALNICWEGLDGYVFCPVAILPQVIQKIITYPCRMIVLAPGWPGMP